MKKSHPLRIFEIKLTVNKNLKSPSYRHFIPRYRPRIFSPSEKTRLLHGHKRTLVKKDIIKIGGHELTLKR